VLALTRRKPRHRHGGDPLTASAADGAAQAAPAARADARRRARGQPSRPGRPRYGHDRPDQASRRPRDRGDGPRVRALLRALAARTAPRAGATKAAEPPVGTPYGAVPGRAGATAGAIAPGGVKPDFVLPIQGRVTSQVLAARDVPVPGSTTLYVATTTGRI